MTTHRTVERHMPAPPPAVLARLQDPDLSRRRAESDPTLPGTVLRHATPGDGPFLELSIRAELPASWLPNAVRRRLPGVPAVVRHEVWQLADDGVTVGVDVELQSVPATRVVVTGTLTPAPGGSLLRQEIALTLDIPVAGGIERVVAGHIAQAYGKELDVIADACR